MSEEAYYVVRDTAGAIYGPANVSTLRQWIAEGRITRQMHVAVQGTTNFVEAGQMPELASAFPDGRQQPAQSATATATTTPTQTATATNPYQATSQNYYNQNYPQTYQQGYQQGYPGYYAKSSGMAIATLICGIGSFAFCPCSIVAIILGHIARGQIRREPDRYEGDGMALAGLIIGYIMGSLGAAVLLFYIVLFILALSGAIH